MVGRIRYGVLAFGFALAAACAAGADGGWKLAWSDEFNGTAIDKNNWLFDTGYIRNNELQYYTERAENARIDKGNLLIQARKDNWGGHAYTSASLKTRWMKSWKYGRFELRAKIDIRLGSWPAFWWMADSTLWPKSGEIDMMEFYRGQLLFNVMDGNGKWYSPRKQVADLGGDRWAKEFHTWTMEWDSLRIDLSLDGVLINHFPMQQADGTGTGKSNPFRHYGYVVLNQAIGGNQGGDPSGTAFPVELRVDYIRVHDWAPGTGRTLTVTGGGGSGTYVAGAPASLSAGLAPAGQVFDRWVVTSGTATVENPTAPETRLVMPAGNVAVKATYKAPVALGRRAAGDRAPRAGGPWFTPLGRVADPGDLPAAGAYRLR